MAKYKVLNRFRDVHTKEIYEVDQEIEMTVKRADEVAKNLDSSFLERLEDTGKEPEDNEKGEEAK